MFVTYTSDIQFHSSWIYNFFYNFYRHADLFRQVRVTSNSNYIICYFCPEGLLLLFTEITSYFYAKLLSSVVVLFLPSVSTDLTAEVKS